ncbi:hypothetical protein QCA50_010918 [Cerrena zonata]|uniref:Uncharacterized protein n=1 Tax=Cerrena zonata TaxID=2478898 RepID=A0AAW0FYQ4_9APHY
MFSRSILVLFVAISAALVQATALDKRQAGDQQCNFDRLEIITDIVQAQKTTRVLATELQGDAFNTQNINAASDGLDKSQDAIFSIVTALVAGQKASPNDRELVADGLDDAVDALTKINSTDPAVVQNLNKIHDQLVAASDAGNRVLEDCK